MRKEFVTIFAMAVLLATGCMDREEISSDFGLPTDDLPEGFKLIAVLNDSTPGVNMDNEIEDFRGHEDIGKVKATVGIYQWGDWGDYDARVTIIECDSFGHAQAAISNYLSHPKFENPPFKGVDRFSNAIVNGHEVTEIRDRVGDDIRYLYIWNDENIVVLVEGNSDRAKSLELASATRL
jgi:hypothetical protein